MDTLNHDTPHNDPIFDAAWRALGGESPGSPGGVFDFHQDSILRWHKPYPIIGRKKDVRKYHEPGPYGQSSSNFHPHADLVRLPKARYRGALMGIHSRRKDSQRAFWEYQKQIDYFRTFFENPHYQWIKRHPEWREAWDGGRIGLAPGVEGAHMLNAPDAARCKDNIAQMAMDGVAYVTLCHTFNTKVASTNHTIWYNRLKFARPTKDHRLSQAGERTVGLLMDYGIAVDVAHVHHKSLEHACDLAAERGVPVLCSHTGMRFEAVAAKVARGSSAKRNLSRDMVVDIVRTGGLIGVFFTPMYLRWDRKQPGSKTSQRVADHIHALVKHIEQACETSGVPHVAIGTDYDGYIDLPDDQRECLDLIKVVYYLMEVYDYSEADIRAMFLTNGHDYLGRVWDTRDISLRP
ncbi:MAG: hypothetical protein D6E12_17540 [Desulfovibrio sp.]|nr:MAG: hypothetical protein D6E12_17540 [Desulfovibrio sp.]